MPDTTNPNEVPKYEVTPELLDEMYERTSRELLARKEEERRAAEWPSEVNKAINTLAARVGALEARFDTLGVGQD